MGIRVLLGPFGPLAMMTTRRTSNSKATRGPACVDSRLLSSVTGRKIGSCEASANGGSIRFGQPAALRYRGGGVRVRSVKIARHAIYGPQELLEVAGVLAEVSLAKP
jgi:hypothetical protein